MPIDISWEDTAQKPEEAEFQKSKQGKLDEEEEEEVEEAEEEQEQQEELKERREGTDEEYESMGIAEMIGSVWNEVATSKGYEAITDKQLEFLNKHTARLEEKHLGDKMKMMPEVEAGLAHLVVYLPKWLKKKQDDADKPKKPDNS